MRLENIAVKLRVRNPYEAIDLGYAMVLSWRHNIFPAWASVYLSAALVINLFCFLQPLVALLILWWLKPAFDRVILHVLSGAAFGQAPSIKETWRALPRLWWNNGLFKALTIRRLDMARSFSLPVTQLERQFGKRARQRRAVLGREARGAAVWLTIISLHFEVLIAISAYVFIDLLVPGASAALNPMQWFLEPPSSGVQYLSNAVTALTIILLEPFYVAAGFALYLNTRTVLEGWDIELKFKRMSARLAGLAGTINKRTQWADLSSSTVADTGSSTAANTVHTANSKNAIVISLLCAGIFCGALLYVERSPLAQTTAQMNTLIDAEGVRTEAQIADKKNTAIATVATPNTGAKTRVKLILADPDYGKMRQTWSIRYVGPGSEPTKAKKYPWLEKMGVWLGQALRILAWVGGAVALMALLFLLVKQIEKGRWRAWLPRKSARQEMLFGMDVRQESLPDDVAGLARQYLANGDKRAALSLLYRGALVFLIADGKIDIARGDTEGICVKNVATLYRNDKANYFATLVRAWQHLAYAGSNSSALIPTATVIEGLINAWPTHFLFAPPLLVDGADTVSGVAA